MVAELLKQRTASDPALSRAVISESLATGPVKIHLSATSRSGLSQHALSLCFDECRSARKRDASLGDGTKVRRISIRPQRQINWPNITSLLSFRQWRHSASEYELAGVPNVS